MQKKIKNSLGRRKNVIKAYRDEIEQRIRLYFSDQGLYSDKSK